ncbi:MAG TPA: PAS domain S-box protein [Thermoanaerobaculia bacterium]|nr:PAS domain S-box protein [Thermoanaerobaculia bacterium]
MTGSRHAALPREPTFRQRIAVGFAVAFLLIAITGAVSYYALHQTALSDRLFAHQARDVIEFGRLRATIEQKMVAARGYLITGDEKFLFEIQQRHQELQEQIRKLRKGDLTKRERELLAEIDAAEDEHQKATEDAVNVRTQGEHAGYFAENVEPARASLERRLSAFLSHEKQILEQTDSASAQKNSLASSLIVVSGFASLGVTAILAVLLTRRLARLYETERHERALAENTRRRYRDLVEGIPGGIVWEADAGTLRLTFVSRRAQEMLGYPADEEHAQPDFWTRLIPAEDRERVLATAARALQNETEEQFEHRFLAADGRTVWFQTRIRLSREEGKPPVLRGLSVDVTRLKEADNALRLRARQQAAVVELGQEALVETDLVRLSERACEVVAETLGAELAAVFKVLPGSRDLLLKAGVGWKEGVAGSETVPATAAAQPGYTLLAGEPILVQDLRAEKRFGSLPLFDDHGVRGGASVVIPGTPSALGVLAVHTRSPRVFTGEDLVFLQSVANVVSAATGRKIADQAVEESERRKAAILHGALDAILTIDYEGRVLEFNPAAESLFGIPASEAIGKEMAELIIPERMRDQHRSGMARYLVTKKAVVLNRRLEMSALRRDGTEFPVELTISRISGDGPPVFTGFVRDITARRRAESDRAGLLASERQARATSETAERRAAFLAEASAALASTLDYRSTLASVARLAVPRIADWCAVDILDAKGDLLRLATSHDEHGRGPAVAEVLRYSSDLEAPHGPAHVFATGEPEVFNDLSDDILRAVARDEEHYRAARDLRLCSSMSVPLNVRGLNIGVLTFGSAIPDRRYGPEDLAFAQDLAGRASAAIENARLYRDAREAVRARDEFLSIASHELKTPLTTLQLQVQGLIRKIRSGARDSPAETVAARLTTAERQVERLTGLINNLLDISRITAGRLDLDLEPVDLGAVVREAAARSREESARAGCEIRMDVNGPCVGQWDRMRVEQVVSNLFSNAIKYGAGRPIEVAVGGDEVLARFTIRDHGIGIPPEHQARIFERFERAVSDRHYGGLGLGLWIVRQIVDALGGSILVESQSGKGSMFTVNLPRTPRKRRSAGAAAAAESSAARG